MSKPRRSSRSKASDSKVIKDNLKNNLEFQEPNQKQSATTAPQTFQIQEEKTSVNIKNKKESVRVVCKENYDKACKEKLKPGNKNMPTSGLERKSKGVEHKKRVEEIQDKAEKVIKESSESVKKSESRKKTRPKTKKDKLNVNGTVGKEPKPGSDEKCEFLKKETALVEELDNSKDETKTDTKLNEEAKESKALKKKNLIPDMQVTKMKSTPRQMQSKKKRVVNNANDFQLVDEVDGDNATSEYFISDCNAAIGHSHKKRKKEIGDNKKSISAKVKHLKLEVSNFQIKKPADNCSSDSDFEEVPDVNLQNNEMPMADVHKISHQKNKSHLEEAKKSLAEDEVSPKHISNPKKRIKNQKETSRSKPDRKRKSMDTDIEGLANKKSKKIKSEKKSDFKARKLGADIKNQDTVKSKSKAKTEATSSSVRKEKQSMETVEVKNRKRKPTKEHDPVKSLKSVDQSDVTALLLHMEGPGSIVQPSTSYSTKDEEVMSDDDSDADDSDDGMDTDESNDEWEDVEDHHGNSPMKSQIPDGPVEITLEAPVIYKKRKKREFDIKAYFQRQINKYKKELNISMHKVHLLCLLSRGFYLNNVCLDETLQAQAMTITMATRELNIASVKTCDVSGLSYMITWMKGAFPLKINKDNTSDGMAERLGNSFHHRYVRSRLEFVLVCVILLRQLGFLTRLVMSLQPIPIKTTAKKDSNSGKKRLGNPAKISKSKKNDKDNVKKTIKGAGTSRNDKVSIDLESRTKKSDKLNKKASNISSENKIHKREDIEKHKSGNKKLLKSGFAVRVDEEKNDMNDPEEKINKRLKTKNKSRRSCASKIKPNTYVDNDGEVDDSADEFIPVSKDNDESSDSESELTQETDGKNSSDGDFLDESFQVRTKALIKQSPSSKNKKVLSSDSGETGGNNFGADEWLEVFLQKEQRWICVDCASCKVNKPYSVEHNATPPVHYVVGFCEDGTLKDVTARYASQWLTNTRKFRADEEWWSETVDCYTPGDRKMQEQEDREIQSHLLQRPLPTSIAAFKSHPLYVLKRHLLKFEAIYPDSAVPLGYIRGEPVYARECVHVLHSRENWLKEGRAVRVGEEPYKHVKSRPKWNRPKENPDALDLEVFGHWQTEVYIPPPAVDGKVPRNAHGNVELFLPSMLPAGTVHLQIPGLNKVAKKLDIDCAAAMVGWEHHCGFSHPLMDGWIVCEEFKDILLAAWDEEQEIIREKEQEKREKRVYGNWKLLIRGALIKERLKKRFDLEEDNKPSGSDNKAVVTKATEKSEKATDYTMSWPQNRQPSKQQHFDVEKL